MLTPEEKFISLRRLSDYHTLLNQYKQDKLVSGVNMDNTPTADSDNPITSNGVYNAIHETNETVKSLVDRVAKNLLYVEPGVTHTDKGITFTTNSDGSISYSGTATSTGYATYTIVTKTNTDGDLFKDCMLYGGIVSSIAFAAIEGTASPYTRYALSSSNAVAIDSIPTGTDIHVYVRVNCTSGTAYSGTFKPMICTVSDWKASPTVVPYALPNTTLTPALIKQVNEGAKNKFNIFNAAEEKSETVTRTINADGTVTVSNSGSNTGPAILYYRTYLTADVPYVISGCPSDGSDASYSLGVRTTDASPIADAIDYGSGSNVFTLSTSGTYLVYLRIATGYALSNAVFKPMICTAEDWAVSHKFVPYAPTNQELIATKADKLKKTLVGSGSLNDISTDEFAIYTSAVTGKPQSGYAFVRTSVFDANAAMQELTMLDGTYSGRSYIRVKNGGTWTAWRETTSS